MAKKPKSPPDVPVSIGDRLRTAAGAALGALPGAGRVSIALLLRGLAANPQCIEQMAKAMAEDEDGVMEWTTLPITEKRNWRGRAQAALGGLNKYVFRRESGEAADP